MKNCLKDNWYKLLAIVMLVGVLWPHQYGYYQVLRWAVMLVGAYSAYLAYENKNTTWAWIFGIIAILFNPLIPFIFTKETWQFIDLITAVVIFMSIIKNKK